MAAEIERVALFWGDQPFLLRLSAMEHLERLDARAREVDGGDWQGGETSDLATPSLWGETRALLVTDCQAMADAGARELLAYVQSPAPDAVCVMTLVSGAKGPPALARAVQQSGGLVRQVTLKPRDLPGWIVQRAKVRGVRLTGPAAAALRDAVGEDPAALDQSVEQLASAFPGRPVGPDDVRSQFRGLGEQRVWALCDHALSGRLPQALVVLRSLLEARDDPILILGGIASRIRDLMRVRALPERLPPAEAVRAAGLRFDWQLRRYREQSGRFTPEGLAKLHERVVESDRALKGGVAGDVVLSVLVAGMAGETGVALDQPIRVSR